jgi:hypothetical protein
MRDDLTAFMVRWPYQSHAAYRVVCGADGNPKLQRRTPLGIEQYELDGRPDGLRPMGEPTLLALWESRLAAYCARHLGAEGFVLPEDACSGLFDEATMMYQRYMALFHTGDFERSERDTTHNLRLADLMERYGEDARLVRRLCANRPGILHLHSASRALLAVRRGDYDRALAEVRRGLVAIRDLKASETNPPREVRRNVAALKRLGREISRQRPRSLGEDIRRRLRDALASEEYEKAADLRDRLVALGFAEATPTALCTRAGIAPA